MLGTGVDLVVRVAVRPAVRRWAHRRGMHPVICCKLSSRLGREWARLSRRIALVERVRSWHLTERRFDTLDEFLAIAGHRRADSVEADAVLRGLVAIAAADRLAGRIVLQRILPGLLAVARVEQAR